MGLSSKSDRVAGRPDALVRQWGLFRAVASQETLELAMTNHL
jgi:hypothetical protein